MAKNTTSMSLASFRKQPGFLLSCLSRKTSSRVSWTLSKMSFSRFWSSGWFSSVSSVSSVGSAANRKLSEVVLLLLQPLTSRQRWPEQSTLTCGTLGFGLIVHLSSHSPFRLLTERIIHLYQEAHQHGFQDTEEHQREDGNAVDG